ncbi:MAG: hypothetical protein J2P15_14185 [Micromonosporaceae bacterium]|nr:hypothetical protein [Micromonosporaceae bacterium]
MKLSRTLRVAIAVLTAILASTLTIRPASAALLGIPQVYLRVLVVTDGSVWVDAIRQELANEGVPTTVIDLNNPSRQTITSSFLSNTPLLGVDKAFYQGVVLPGNFVPALSASEQSALATYEQTFQIRQIEGYDYPNGDIGMNAPTYSGSLDAATVSVSSTAKSGAFRYLNGSFSFEGSPGGTESYGYLAQPLPNTATTSYTPYLTATTPTGATGVLAGVYNTSGRERLAINFAYSYFQNQFRFISHGLVDWVTKGIHLGYWRNYFNVHIDDIFSDTSMWNSVANCTPGDDFCPPGTQETDVRMNADDARFAANWEQANGFTLDMLFNGGNEADFQASGDDPMYDALHSLAGSFRWDSHTFTHAFLGCVQDFSTNPWRCATDSAGNTVWVDQSTIDNEIQQNIDWANANGFPTDPKILVVGEHSGTKVLPQQPMDNPNFVASVNAHQISYLGLDASREPAARMVGNALGVPRHPLNVFYNASTKAEEVDEYNWIYNSKADGGSGLCENNPTSTCIAPLDPATGWDSYILPLQIKIALSYVVRSDPRVFFMHQANLTGDRLAYPVMAGILAAYRSVYTSSAPALNSTFAATGQALNAQQVWATKMDSVTAYATGPTVVVTGPAGTQIPVTAPSGTVVGTALLGDSYGGEASAQLNLLPINPLVMLSSPYPALLLPAILPGRTAIQPNITLAPHVAIDPGLGMLFPPLVNLG